MTPYQNRLTSFGSTLGSSFRLYRHCLLNLLFVSKYFWIHLLRGSIDLNKSSQSSWPVWLNGRVFVNELSGCRFKSRCCHHNFTWFYENFAIELLRTIGTPMSHYINNRLINWSLILESFLVVRIGKNYVNPKVQSFHGIHINYNRIDCSWSRL